MIFKIDGATLVIEREEDDPKFYGGESRLFYRIKNNLNSMGFDLIKKRMWKDGHMVDDLQQYLRTRSCHSKSPHIYIYNNNWALFGAEEEWNKGSVRLALGFDIWEKQPDARERVGTMLPRYRAPKPRMHYWPGVSI